MEREISRLHSTRPRWSSPTASHPGTLPHWTASTEVVRRGEALVRVAELRAGTGGDIVCFGSLRTWNDLLAHGVVDELHILVGPGAIGSGVPTFNRPVERELTLLDVRRMEDSQPVALRYAVSEARRAR